MHAGGVVFCVCRRTEGKVIGFVGVVASGASVATGKVAVVHRIMAGTASLSFAGMVLGVERT